MSLENVNDLVRRGKAKLIAAAVQEALDEGAPAIGILNTMIAAMDVVGGAPITQEFADRIGADACTPDAASAVKKAKELVS